MWKEGIKEVECYLYFYNKKKGKHSEFHLFLICHSDMKYYKCSFQISNSLTKIFSITPLEKSEDNLPLQFIHVYIKSL